MRVQVELFDSALTKIGFGDGFELLEVTVRLNAVGSCKLTLSAGHSYASKLLIPGTRVVVWCTPDGGNQFQLFSGPVARLGMEGTAGTAAVTAECESDWTLLRKILGWPVPGSAITAQSGAEFWTATGPAETVIKNLITANAVTRLGRPVTVATNLARGTTVDASVRFLPLADPVADLAARGGLGVSVTQGPSGIVVDVFEGVDRTARVFDEDNGGITSWSWSSAIPSATRAIGGGPGEGPAREFRSAVDSARETAEHDVIETFVDITGATSGSDLTAKTAAALPTMGRTTGLTVNLAENSAGQYGRTFLVGDLVRMRVLDIEADDVLREATLTFTSGDGPVISPTVGDPLVGTPEKTLIKQLAAMARSVRGHNTR